MDIRFTPVLTLVAPAGGLPVVEASVGVPIVRNDYTINPAPFPGGYIQIVAATALVVAQLEIFDSSGETLSFAFGAAGLEVEKLKIEPGGPGLIPLAVPAGTRLSVKALTDDSGLGGAQTGELIINGFA